MEKINEILAKDTLWEEDIQFLLANESLLPESARVRLGLPTTVVEEPVVLVAEPVKVVEFVNETPKTEKKKRIIKK